MFVPDIVVREAFFAQRKIFQTTICPLLINKRNFTMSVSPACFRARRLSRMINECGEVMASACVNCHRFRRLCVMASFTRRCSECTARSLACTPRVSSSSTSIWVPSSEIALRSEIDRLLVRLRICLAELESLSSLDSFSIVDPSHTGAPHLGN
jgi:hypothetical protein